MTLRRRRWTCYTARSGEASQQPETRMAMRFSECHVLVGAEVGRAAADATDTVLLPSEVAP